MSCDNIGSHVPPSFSARFKEDPYHVPGYQGYVPQFKYKSEGKTFSDATKTLFENPCVASSGKLILADIQRDDGGSLVKPGFECKVWEAETKRCREIQARCLPGCYNKPPAQYPQPYLNFLQPANVFHDECRRTSLRPEVGVTRPEMGVTQLQPEMGRADCGRSRAGGDLIRYRCDDAKGRFLERKGVGNASGRSDEDLRKQLKREYLICPSQTVYDPKTDSRYFMFSQQNVRNCGEIAPRPPPPGNCVSMGSCKEICPCPQTQLKIRQLYPECGGMMSGYGGHIPGFNDCTLGDNYKKATAKVLKQVVGGKREYPGPWTLKFPDCEKMRMKSQRCANKRGC